LIEKGDLGKLMDDLADVAVEPAKTAPLLLAPNLVASILKLLKKL